MTRSKVGVYVLAHRRAMRFALLLLLATLLGVNAWSIYTRALILADQGVLRAAGQIEQHFSHVFGFLDTLRVETEQELGSLDKLDAAAASLQALQDDPSGQYFQLDSLKGGAGGRQLGNLTGTGRIATLDVAARREMEVVVGLSPLFEAAYRNLDVNGVAWVYFVSARRFIYLYPYTPSANYHYSAITEQGAFWRLGSPEGNPTGRRVLTPVYIDQAGKGPMLSVVQPLRVGGAFAGVLCMDITTSTLVQLLKPSDAELGSLYLVNGQDQLVAATSQQALPQENLLNMPVSADYLLTPNAHIKVYPINGAGLRLVHYLPTQALAIDVFQRSLPALFSGLLLWLVLGMLLKTWELNHNLHRLSEQDPLTGAMNHRAFQTRLSELFDRYQLEERPFSLVMCDLDHFKRINDTLGHAKGDQVLKVLVKLAKRSLRLEDGVARLGGEEFVLILPDTSMREALKAAVRLRLQLERLDWARIGIPGRVTASMGCATVLPGDRCGENVLKRADDAMYRAKQEGRNRVCADLMTAEDPVRR
ncbi:sensor domain-containing diguanylate cyclase [uncultured Aquitalea sp.]|uniref:sensor domain-containing diguanylate cyclase n=1 Tax=uncultured Aquitalea sp. TaxID=540272 RepID=UPI0025F0DD1B|nr:sensor domain-containing diguanylate cyclase [uncultured Aquitalea sp.]